MGELLVLLLLACTVGKPDGGTPALLDSGITTTGDSTLTPTDSTVTTDSTLTGDDTSTTETDTSPDADGDGWTVAEGDCDDANPDVNPGEREVDDDADQDCDGQVDDGFRNVRTFLRSEVVVDGNRYVSARNWVEFRNDFEEVVCTYSAAVAEGLPPATLCPECIWAFGFETGMWTQAGDACDLIDFVWFGLDYLNAVTAEGAYDSPRGYSTTAPDRWDPNLTVYQQIWIYEEGDWRQSVDNDASHRGVYEYGSGTYVWGGQWYSYTY